MTQRESIDINCLASSGRAVWAGLRAGRWQTTLGTELAGQTIGIIELGNIGLDIARYARAFNMRVLAWSQNLTEPEATARGAELVTKDKLFSGSDIASVHLRLSQRTRGLIGEQELALLGPRGYLVNTSRAPIVDEQALIRALRDGIIAGAALDVFDTEPLPLDHPLLSTPNTLLTPHIGFVARRSYERFYGDAVEDVLGWLRGRRSGGSTDVG